MKSLSHHVAFDALPDGVAIFDRATGAVLDANASMCRMHGYAREELIGLTVEDLCAAAPDAGFASAERIIQQATAERPRKVRWLARRKDREHLWVEVHLRRAEIEGEACVVATVREAGAVRNACEKTDGHEGPGRYEAGTRAYTRLQEVLCELPVYVFRQDRDLCYTWLSSTVSEVDAQALLGRSDDALLPDEEAARIRSVKRHVLETGEPARVEMQGTLGERRRLFETHLVPERDATEGITGLLGATIDVTERWEAEQAGLESKRRYRQLFEAAQDGIAITTPEGEIVDANLSAQEILGYSREELLTMNAAELYVDPEQRRRGADLIAAEGAVRDFEVRVRRKNGEEVICQLSSTARRGPDGAIEAFQTFFRDVTDEKRALQALRDSKERFHALAEKALVGIALLQEGSDQKDSQEVVYQYVNPAFAQLGGYASEEIVGQSPRMLFHPDDWPHVRETLRKRFAGEAQEAHYEARFQTKTGEVRVVEVHGSRFMYRGKPAVIGTALDITERRHLEKELLWVQEEERRRIGRELHDGVASELTGAGALISVAGNKAKNGTPITPEELDRIGKLITESSRKIRTLSRGLSPTELGAGVAPALKGLAERAGAQSELACSFEAMGETPDLPEESAMHLYRIAQGAVQNAVRHTEARRIRIRYGTEAEGDLLLEIHDDGGGRVERVLLESTEGFGLRSMRYRANLIGGTLVIEETSEGGAVVRFRLPARRFQSSAAE